MSSRAQGFGIELLAAHPAGQRLEGDAVAQLRIGIAEAIDQCECAPVAVGGIGHRDAHVGTSLPQEARQLGGFVGRDAARDAEKDPPAGQRHRPDPRLRGNDSK